MRENVRAAILLALPYGIVLVATRLGFPPIVDEVRYHLPIVLAMGNGWPLPDLTSYNVASTPLPAYLLALWGKLLGYDLPRLRVATLLVTYLTMLLFYDCARRVRLKHPLLLTWVFLFFPYIFLHAFTIYSTNYALFWGVLALNFYLRGESLRWRLGSALALTAAVYSRQNYLAYVAGAALAVFWSALHEKVRVASALRSAILFAIPVAALLPLFFFWGGLTPPQFARGYSITFNAAQLPFLSLLIGFYFLPAVWDVWVRRRRLPWVLGAGLTLVTLMVWGPRWALPEAYEMQGLVIRILHAATDHAFLLGLGALWVLTLVGWTVSAHALLPTRMPVLVAILGALLVIQLFTPLRWERYFTPFVPVLLLQMWDRCAPTRRLALLWASYATVLGAIYCVGKMLA